MVPLDGYRGDGMGEIQQQLMFPTKDNPTKPLLMIMDGHALIHRAFRAIFSRQAFTTSSGEDTTGVYGFSNTFIRAIQQIEPTHCIMAFDSPGPTFRHTRFEKYKAGRPATPKEMVHQFGRVKELMTAFRVPVIEIPGFEADDIIGTLTTQAEKQSINTIVLTGDTDTLQLVSSYVRVLLFSGIQNQKIYDIESVKERFGGLGPEYQIEIKAIKGDSSDNIPGLPGVGEKTAIKVLKEYHNLEGIYDNLKKVTPERIKLAFEANRDQVFESRWLVTIDRNTPVDLDMESSRFWTYRREDVVEFMRELEFGSIIPRVPASNLPPSEITITKPLSDGVVKNYHLVDDQKSFEKMVCCLRASKSFSFDTETNSLDPMNAVLVGLSFSTSEGVAWYVPVGHSDGKQLATQYVIDQLRPDFENRDISKSGHNLNFDLSVLMNYDITVQGLHCDTMLSAHLLGKKGIGLKNLASDVLRQEMTPISELIGTGKGKTTMDCVPIERVLDYACADADFTGRLARIFEDELKDRGLWGIFTTVEMPLISILVSMQRSGITLDKDILQSMDKDLTRKIGNLETEIYLGVGHTFKINSPQQLSTVLFQELGLRKTKRTKTGYSTDANSLEFLRGQHSIVESILEYRKFSKLKSTYVDALPGLVDESTGRIHTRYNQAGSATGRISSNDPNLQNIPVRTEIGREVRKAFVSRGIGGQPWHFVSADYSQIELRVLAHLSKDTGLVEAFQNQEDIHSSTASMMFDIPLTEVGYDERRIAKILNFGVIYGLSAFGISQQTEFGPDEGRKFIDTYFAKYPRIQEYIDSTKKSARNLGYVETMLGRRRYIPEVNGSNAIIRNAGERMAINMPIQGTAADIVKLAMLRVHRGIEEQKLRSKMLLQVHDELIFEVPGDEMRVMSELLFEEMPRALDSHTSLIVPLEVEIKTGLNWGDMR